MNQTDGKTGALIHTFILLLAVLVVGCSRPSRDNDNFLSRAPSEIQEHYKFIDTYRTMNPSKLDSVIQLFDNRYDNDSSSIESAYYNLAFAYREYIHENYKGALSLLLRVENALDGRDFLVFEAEMRLLAGVIYQSLALDKFAEESFKNAYSYFREGDYPNQTMLAALNLAYLASSDSLKESSSKVDSYIDLSDSIFINHNSKVRYVNYYHYKYLIDRSNTGYLDSILTVLDIAEEPSTSIMRLYNMNLNLLITLNDKREYTKSRVVLDRMNIIYNKIGDKCLPRLRKFHIFEESIVLATEGHYKRALDLYQEGVDFNVSTPNLRIEVNRSRALYKIYYYVNDIAKRDSALTSHRAIYSKFLNEKSDDALSTLLEYRDFHAQKNLNILKENQHNRYIQFVLVIIGLALIAYIISLYRVNQKIKQRSQLRYGDPDKYIEQLEEEIRESNMKILELEIDELIYKELYPNDQD